MSRITNDPRSPAAPRRAGHLQSILRVCHSRACHFQAVRGHPTGCRRGRIGRILRAARPPVAIQSVRNSRETYLRCGTGRDGATPSRPCGQRSPPTENLCEELGNCNPSDRTRTTQKRTDKKKNVGSLQGGFEQAEEAAQAWNSAPTVGKERSATAPLGFAILQPPQRENKRGLPALFSCTIQGAINKRKEKTTRE